MPLKMNWGALAAVLVPNLGGWIGEVIVKENKSWYEALKKPKYSPPRGLSALMWTILYCALGCASFWVWHEEKGGFDGQPAVPLTIYGINILLSWAWTPLFYAQHNLKLALIDVIILWITTIPLGATFFYTRDIAGYIVIPYFVWISYLTVVNYVVYRDNRQEVVVEKAETEIDGGDGE